MSLFFYFPFLYFLLVYSINDYIKDTSIKYMSPCIFAYVHICNYHLDQDISSLPENSHITPPNQ